MAALLCLVMTRRRRISRKRVRSKLAARSADSSTTLTARTLVGGTASLSEVTLQRCGGSLAEGSEEETSPVRKVSLVVTATRAV